MTRRFRGLASGLAVVAVLASYASAGGWAGSALGKAQFGAVWNDRPFDPSDLAGRVVLVKTWADG